MDHRPTTGVLWWYSTSSVLLGVVVADQDPTLANVTLLIHPDGRILDAQSTPLPTDPGLRLALTLSTAIESVSRCSNAPRRALWAIATDSLANRMLWAGRTPTEARQLAASVGDPLPVPRYLTVSGRLVVRRASCCLIYLAPDMEKCTSCPRQPPEERLRRLSMG